MCGFTHLHIKSVYDDFYWTIIISLLHTHFWSRQ
uniref:Uncharacterized protein n=1 Tax=Anguilla anguilla TaxID=7936 RepID=A0A0E9U9R1_ANGAN